MRDIFVRCGMQDIYESQSHGGMRDIFNKLLWHASHFKRFWWHRRCLPMPPQRKNTRNTSRAAKINTKEGPDTDPKQRIPVGLQSVTLCDCNAVVTNCMAVVAINGGK